MERSLVKISPVGGAMRERTEQVVVRIPVPVVAVARGENILIQLHHGPHGGVQQILRLIAQLQVGGREEARRVPPPTAQQIGPIEGDLRLAGELFHPVLVHDTRQLELRAGGAVFALRVDEPEHGGHGVVFGGIGAAVVGIEDEMVLDLGAGQLGGRQRGGHQSGDPDGRHWIEAFVHRIGRAPGPRELRDEGQYEKQMSQFHNFVQGLFVGSLDVGDPRFFSAHKSWITTPRDGDGFLCGHCHFARTMVGGQWVRGGIAAVFVIDTKGELGFGAISDDYRKFSRRETIAKHRKKIVGKSERFSAHKRASSSPKIRFARAFRGNMVLGLPEDIIRGFSAKTKSSVGVKSPQGGAGTSFVRMKPQKLSVSKWEEVACRVFAEKSRQLKSMKCVGVKETPVGQA